jgi:hypothetical protein
MDDSRSEVSGDRVHDVERRQNAHDEAFAGLFSAPSAGSGIGIVLTVAGGLLIAFGSNTLLERMMP